jgi:biotin operon repressor
MTPKRTTRTRQSGVSSAVLKYLQRHRGIEVEAGDIAEGMNLTRQQVTSAIAHLRENGTVIDSPHKGWYVYRGTEATAHHAVTLRSKAEVVSLLNDGQLLINVEGVIYVASELEIQT